MKKIKQIFILLLLVSAGNLYAQEHPDFEIIKQCKTSEIKNQQNSGTCWSFATTSFIESELLRTKGEEFDLSEMYFVKYAYISKAQYYVRLHGKTNFSQGGQAHDVINEIVNYGIVAETAYSGLVAGAIIHDHSKLEKELKSYLDSIIGLKNVPYNWLNVFSEKLDSHLGTTPQKIEYKTKEYSPQEYQKNILAFNPDDYIEITSYSHHPFYTTFDLEVPDNWSHNDYYNLPIEEFMKVVDNAINNDYTISWDGDVSEAKFEYRKGKCDLEKTDKKELKNKSFQNYRQETFENQSSTDDHLMHLTGIAKNKKGEKYYIIKNSWGNSNKYGGYLYMSEDYLKLKTVAIMVHKNAVPKKIMDKF